MDTFIAKFVLCGECKNPETDLIITKDGHIIRDCKACGQRTHVDLRHKLSGYILKNPPKKEKKEKKTSSKKSKKGGENGDEKDSNGHGSGGNSEEEKGNGDLEIEAGSDDELTRRIQQEARDLPNAGDAAEKDADWAIDMSKEAIADRAKGLAEAVKGSLILNDDDEEEEAAGGENPYEKLGAWVDEQKKANNGEVDDIEIYKKAVELGIEKKHKTLQVLAQTIFDENIVKQIPKRAALLNKVWFNVQGLVSDVYEAYSLFIAYCRFRPSPKSLPRRGRTIRWQGPP